MESRPTIYFTVNNLVIWKSHLLRYSDFSATQNTTYMISCLKNHYALPYFMVLVKLLNLPSGYFYESLKFGTF
jgi:hypothetical protein